MSSVMECIRIELSPKDIVLYASYLDLDLLKNGDPSQLFTDVRRRYPHDFFKGDLMVEQILYNEKERPTKVVIREVFY